VRIRVLLHDSRALKTRAGRVMRDRNARAVIAFEHGRVVIIEEVPAGDDGYFSLEYRCDPEGRECEAILLYDPLKKSFEFRVLPIEVSSIEKLIDEARRWCLKRIEEVKGED